MLTVENLSLERVRYRWYGRKRWVSIFNNINLTLPQGEVVALVGGSGEGKSLLLQCLLAMLPSTFKTQGGIRLNGISLNAKACQQLRGNTLCYIPQNVSALNPLLNVKKHFIRTLTLSGQAICYQRMMAQLRHYQLPAEILNYYPHQLSGGMAKRVLACNAALSQARFILADEISAWLDHSIAFLLLQQLRDFSHQGAGVLWVTHDLALATRYADRLVMLHQGQIIDNLPVKAILHGEGSPTLRQFWQAQPKLHSSYLGGL